MGSSSQEEDVSFLSGYNSYNTTAKWRSSQQAKITYRRTHFAMCAHVANFWEYTISKDGPIRHIVHNVHHLIETDEFNLCIARNASNCSREINDKIHNYVNRNEYRLRENKSISVDIGSEPHRREAFSISHEKAFRKQFDVSKKQHADSSKIALSSHHYGASTSRWCTNYSRERRAFHSRRYVMSLKCFQCSNKRFVSSQMDYCERRTRTSLLLFATKLPPSNE